MPTSDHLVPRPFRGFRRPSYTQVPDELFDELLVELSGAELKVLLYIIRRTFGFKRDSDNISLSQMLNGIRTQDGRVLDRGVGLSKKTLLLALRTLKERGVILAEWRQSVDKGNEPTSYCLNVLGADDDAGGPDEPDDPRDEGGPNGPGDRSGQVSGQAGDEGVEAEKSPPPLGEKLPQGGGVKTPPPLGEKFPLAPGGKITPGARGKNYTTQQTVEQQTVRQETESAFGASSTRFDGTTLHINTASTVTPELRGSHIYVQSLWERPPADDLSPSPGPAHSASLPLTPDPATLDDSPSRFLAHPRDHDRILSQPAGPASPQALSSAVGSASAPQPPSPRIAAQIEQVSDEFHDEDHVKPNIGQAVRLWHASGLDEAVFADRLLEARSITKRRVVHKPASGESGEFGLRNKMPYFFTVLRDLLGLQDA